MPHPTMSAAEIVSRGKSIYENQLRQHVEAGNFGKYLLINTETGEYVMDKDQLAASGRAQATFPGAPIFGMRIGLPTGGRIGGKLRSTNP